MTDAAPLRAPGTARILILGVLSFAAGLAVAWGIYRHTHPEPDLSAPNADLLLEEVEKSYFDALAGFKKQCGGGGAYVNRRDRTLLRILKEMKTENCSSVYNAGIWNEYEAAYRKAAGKDLDGVMLEIGPGANLGTGLLFAMGGAAKYYGLDIYQDPHLYGSPTYEAARDLIQYVAPGRIRVPMEKILTIRDGRVEFAKERIEYLYPRQSYDIPLADDSLDFAFSHATLEHVADPAKTIAALRRVLRPGGITAHVIDLRDHRDFDKPLEFLKIDAAVWKEEYKDPEKQHLYMNRWRRSDFRKAFEEGGFEILSLEPTIRTEATEALRSTLHPDFRGYPVEELSVTGVRVVSRKR